MAQPPARVEPVRDTYFGVTLEDPYRWLEEWQSDEARAWLDAQAAHSRALFAALPHRAALRDRIAALIDVTSELQQLRAAGERAFYLRRDPGQNQARLIVRDTATSEERVLLDPATIPNAEFASIDWFVPSCDGRLVAYGLSHGGSEDSTLHVLDVASGADQGEAIRHVRFEFVSWLEDASGFVYHRYSDPAPDTPPAERRYDSRCYLHRLGADPAQDQLILGRGLNSHVEMTRIDRPFVIFSETSDWAVAIISHSALGGGGRLSDCTLYVAPRAALADPATCPWAKVAAAADGVTNIALHGDTLYLLLHRDAPRYRVLAVDAARPDLATARVVVPESEVVIEQITISGDALFVHDSDGGLARLRQVPLAGGDPAPIALPFDGTILGWAATADGGLLLQLTSWTVPPQVYRYDPATGTVSDTGWITAPGLDLGEIEAHEVLVTARDGVRVPLTIIHRRGLQRTGDSPTILTGYGSYGFSVTPFCDPTLLAWYERGGIFAVAHLRGGGEYGRAWHEAGLKLNKERTITDFIDCAEYLIAQGYTRPERLAGEGGSAGGIPTGGALVRRPDLWAVMLMHVAMTNALRAEFGENGPINVPEFGTVTTEEGFASLQIADAYMRVADGVAYPAVYLTTGLNDPRVPVWQATKMAARLQAATTSGKPVLVRVEEQGGHGAGVTTAQLVDEQADRFAFVLDQFGL